MTTTRRLVYTIIRGGLAMLISGTCRSSISPPALAAAFLHHHYQATATICSSSSSSSSSTQITSSSVPPKSLSSSSVTDFLAASSTSTSSSWSPPIFIPDAQPLYPLSAFALPQYLLDSGELEAVLLPAGMIQDRIDKMAEDLLLDLKMRSSSSSSSGPYELHLLCVLKGAGRFYHYLFDSLRRQAQASRMPLQIKMEYIKVRSYSGMQSTGTVNVSGCNLDELKDKNVVIVEDIIDTGNTLRKLVPLLHSHHLASLRVLALFQKRLMSSQGGRETGKEAGKEVEAIPNLGGVGFSLPDKFAVGYGMDLEEHYRDVEHLCLLSQKGIEKHLGQK